MKTIITIFVALITINTFAKNVTTEEFIAANEGFHGTVYTCQAGKKTIGYGFTAPIWTDKGTMTKDEATVVLRCYIDKINRKLNKLVKVQLTDDQRTVLVDFCYQYGVGAFASSTLLKKINANAPAKEIHAEIRKWNKVKDPKTGKYVESKGLNNRNDRRVALWGN